MKSNRNVCKGALVDICICECMCAERVGVCSNHQHPVKNALLHMEHSLKSTGLFWKEYWLFHQNTAKILFMLFSAVGFGF